MTHARPGRTETLPRPLETAFTLLELIAVITIMAILIALSVPAFQSMSDSAALTRAGDEVVGLLSNARQYAISRNHSVEVRFYDLSTTEEDDDFATIIQVVHQIDDGEFVADKAELSESNASGRNLVRLPVGIGISREEKLSSFFNPTVEETGLLLRGTAGSALPLDADATFVGFRFLPDGSTELPTTKWFLTLVPRNTAPPKTPDDPPPNFYTIQLDPTMGKIRVFRP